MFLDLWMLGFLLILTSYRNNHFTVFGWFGGFGPKTFGPFENKSFGKSSFGGLWSINRFSKGFFSSTSHLVQLATAAKDCFAARVAFRLRTSSLTK